jgi:hypothetical protein
LDLTRHLPECAYHRVAPLPAGINDSPVNTLIVFSGVHSRMALTLDAHAISFIMYRNSMLLEHISRRLSCLRLLRDDVVGRCCQSNGNSSPVRRSEPKPKWRLGP